MACRVLIATQGASDDRRSRAIPSHCVRRASRASGGRASLFKTEARMERSNVRTVVALVLALIGGYLLSVSADPARGVTEALLALVAGTALGLVTLFLL